jgi:putative ABC transport system permease protein
MPWYRRFLNLVRSERTSHDIEREMRFHVAETVDALVAGGMREEDALREARRRFGNYGLQKERTRDADILPWLDSFGADLRYAVRAMRMAPGFSLVAILSLGLGIGANTAIFSFIDAVLLRSLPVARPQELMQVKIAGSGNPGSYFTNPLWEQLRDRQAAFSGVFAFGNARFDVSQGSTQRSLAGQWVSGEFFSTLGVQPELGRTIVPSDDRRGCPVVAVLAHGFWQSEYGGNPRIVGQSIALNGTPAEVVGVTRPDFIGVVVGQTTQVYVPLCAMEAIRGSRLQLDHRSTWFLQVIGRRKAGLTPAGVAAQLATVSRPVFTAAVPEHWPVPDQKDFLAQTLVAKEAATGVSSLRSQYRPALIALMGIVGLVLLIACANVANLLVARATARQREIAIRLAIGAGRGRLVSQLLTESLLLSFISAGVGLLFARWSGGLLLSYLSTQNNVVTLDLSLDPRVLAFTIGISVLTGLLFGVAPAWRSMQVDPQSAMKTGPGQPSNRSAFAVGRTIVVVQVALSLVLVTGAGLLLSTFWHLTTLDPGFDRSRVLLANVSLRRTGVPANGQRALYDRILTRVRAVPGVRSASASELTPLEGSMWNDFIVVEGYTPPTRDDALAYMNGVTDGYFETLGTALLAGRDLDAGDVRGAELVAVVNETFARQFFAGANPIGRTYRTARGKETGPPIRIVGLVRDAKYGSLRETMLATAYLPVRQDENSAESITFELRATGAATSVVPAVTAAVAEIDPRITLSFTTLEAQVSASILQERLLATLSGFFGALALVLAMIGLYGLMSYTVARQRRELGIRLALGAARGRVLGHVLGEAGRLVALGLVLGALASLAMTRLVRAFLYGVEASDPTIFLVSAITLSVVALAAGLLPARRAARLDPMIALREE